MARLKIPLYSRARALILLQRGRPQDEIATEMRRRNHPHATKKQVAAAYFPKKGPFAIGYMVGEDRPEILRRFEVMKGYARRGRANIKKLLRDPAHIEQLTERIQRINADERLTRRRLRNLRLVKRSPRVLGPHVERTRKMHQDPEFRDRRISAVKRFWADYRARKAAELQFDIPVGWDNRQRVRLHPTLPNSEAFAAMVQASITAAMRDLTPVQRLLISERYNLDHIYADDVLFKAARLSARERDIEIRRAFKILRSDSTLKRLNGLEPLVRHLIPIR